MWDAQLLRSILLELGITKETSNEKQRTKFQKILALRKLILCFNDKYTLIKNCCIGLERLADDKSSSQWETMKSH